MKKIISKVVKKVNACPVCKKREGVAIEYSEDSKMAFMCCRNCDFFVRGWAYPEDKEKEYNSLLHTWNDNNEREVAMYWYYKYEDELYSDVQKSDRKEEEK